jgi:hypothetical protein
MSALGMPTLVADGGTVLPHTMNLLVALNVNYTSLLQSYASVIVCCMEGNTLRLPKSSWLLSGEKMRQLRPFYASSSMTEKPELPLLLWKVEREWKFCLKEHFPFQNQQVSSLRSHRFLQKP